MIKHAAHRLVQHMYTNSESGLATMYKACCTQVGPAHIAGGDGLDG